jgi:hypothetical protein
VWINFVWGFLKEAEFGHDGEIWSIFEYPTKSSGGVLNGGVSAIVCWGVR